MKIRDIKETLDFLSNTEGMERVNGVITIITSDCPSELGLKKADGCIQHSSCFECWKESLELKANEDKLEDEIKES